MTEIRPMEEQDVGSVRDLLCQLAEDLDQEFQMDHEHCMTLHREMLRHEDFYQNYVCCIDHVVVGFLSMVTYQTFFHRRGTALINELVVRREWRGQHIGSALLAHVMTVAQNRGMDEIEIGVMRENRRALAFYRDNGFNEEYVLLGKEFQ